MEHESTKSVILIGDGRMAQESLYLLEAHPGIHVAAVIYHKSTAHGFRRLRPVDIDNPDKLIGCDNVNDPDVLSTIEKLNPDLMFSVNNFDRIGLPLLGIPVDGIVNFHNGPLPEYRGVNIPSWAIINGEKHHSVTWHYVDRSFDSGTIVREKQFELSGAETAISLIFKCIDEGIDLLPGILDDYLAGTLESVPQEGEGRYYAAKDTPNGGRIIFSMTCEAINRFVRGLTFHPFRGDFGPPHFVTAAGPICVGQATRAKIKVVVRPVPTGHVTETSDSALVIRCKNGFVALKYLADYNGRILDVKQLHRDFGLEPGTRV